MKILEEIGLTKGEIKTYLALLKTGPSSTGPIAKESGVSRSKLYVILDKLEKKGLVGHIIEGKIKQFKAMKPKRILEYLDEKEKKKKEERKIIAEDIIPQLELRELAGKKKTEATLFRGFKAIKNFYRNILEELSAGDEYYVLGAGYGKEEAGVKEFFQNYHTQRAKKKIKVKMLANHDTKGKLVKATTLKSEIKYLPQYLITNMIIVFYKNKALMFFLTEEPTGFLIESEEIVEGFKKYFNNFWKQAKA